MAKAAAATRPPPSSGAHALEGRARIRPQLEGCDSIATDTALPAAELPPANSAQKTNASTLARARDVGPDHDASAAEAVPDR